MFAFFFSQQTKQISSFVFWENLRHANPALGSIWPLVNDFFQNFHKWGLSSGNKKVTLLFAFLCIFRYSRDSQSQTYSPTFPRKTRNYKEGQWIARKKAIKMVIQWDQTRFCSLIENNYRTIYFQNASFWTGSRKMGDYAVDKCDLNYCSAV